MFIKGKIDDLNTILQRVNKYDEKGKTEEAIKELEKAIQLNPNDGNYYNRLGDLYIRDHKVKESIDAYKKGIDAYRNDSFSRNAIAVCKKILRYDPDSIGTYKTIAELLIELGEKSDAVHYFFEYIEKQRARNNVEEVINTLEHVRGLGSSDATLSKRISDVYEALGRDDLTEKSETEIEAQRVSEEAKTPQMSTQKTETTAVDKDEQRPRPQKAEFDKPAKRFDATVTHLDTAVKDIETAIVELRKAVRLDEVIVALDKSLTTLSSEQKKAIGFLQKSLHLNLDTLQKAIKNLRESSDKNTEGLETLFKNLDRILAGLNKDQATSAQKMSESLEKVTTRINVTTKEALKQIKDILSTYKEATDEMCRMFSETKDCNMSLLKITEEMNLTEQKMNESLTAFITIERFRAKKQKYFSIAYIALAALICGLLFVSIIR